MTKRNPQTLIPVPAAASPPAFRSYGRTDLRRLPQLKQLSRDRLQAMDIVARVLPFKVNNYVVENLIDWTRALDDPIFRLTFPQPGMLRTDHFNEVAGAVRSGDREHLLATIHAVREELNPHPAGQKDQNVPQLSDGTPLPGMQHKYTQTVLFFPSQGQTCHAYCTFCFRWPQFVAIKSGRFAMREATLLIRYLREHPEVTDLLITGGDPLIMRAKILSAYVDAVLKADLPGLQTIRIGTKALSYWPHRFVSDPDTPELLQMMRRVTERGLHLALMAHVNHVNELQTGVAEQALRNIRATGAEVRSQSPLMRRINDAPEDWTTLWQRQVRLGMVPYYMFLARDTGAQHHFAVPLVRAWEIYSEAIRKTSGLARTARGPSMSSAPGKIEISGVARVRDQRVLVLRMLQGRNPDWAYRPFFAEYDERALWLDDLRPAFGEREFFFEREAVAAGDEGDEFEAVAAA
ncbi:MAG: lysine 2,3-aminomutase [Verrucomicrobiales bacterium]|nr:lysine 2,3-aminomutase [Verrucomicrobiales bacterium]